MTLIRETLGTAVTEPVPDDAPLAIGDATPDDFCRRIHPKLVGALRLYLGRPDIAEELAQDALVRVIQNWPRVAAMDHGDAWTFRVAFNLANSRLRRGLAEHRANTRSGPPATVHWNVDVAEVLTVRAAVAALPPRQREAIVLRYFGDLSVEQIAHAMSCRPGTVKAHLHQALANLRAAGLVTTDRETP